MLRGPAPDRASGRELLARAVADLTGADVTEVVIGAVCPDCGGDHGRPIVRAPQGVWASLTRVGAVGIAAASTAGPIGIDAEPWNVDAAKIRGAASMLGIETDDALANARRIIRAWTIAEAVLKADGRGLRVDPSAVHWEQAADGVIAAIGDEPGRWTVITTEESDLCVSVANFSVARAARPPGATPR